MEEDNKIIQKVVNGDTEAFGQLIDKYAGRLYGFIYGILGNEHDSMDIVQETFFKAYGSIKSFNTNKNFVTWLFTIAKNNTYNHLKARKRYMSRNAAGEFELLDNSAPDAFEPEQEAVKRAESERLIKAVDSLPEKYRQLIYLKYIEGLSYKAISERLKISESLVDSRIFTARRKLASLMKESE